MSAQTPALDNDAADRNWRRFVLFNARFYYPVLAVPAVGFWRRRAVLSRVEVAVDAVRGSAGE